MTGDADAAGTLAATPDDPAAYAHRYADINGLRLHYIDAGAGPLVILLHGFPLFWYSWRKQIGALAAAGYRVVVPDQRGYGRSGRPETVEAYDLMHLAGDVVGLIHALGEKSAILVGWDWGSAVAQRTALLRPDLIRALVMVAYPFVPRGPSRPSQAWQAVGQGKVFYQQYFQQVGKAEADAEANPHKFMRNALCALAASAAPNERFRAVADTPANLADYMPDATRLPDWLSVQALDYYAAEFAHSGLAGPLNWYRNIDSDWEASACLAGATIRQPALYIGGADDFAHQRALAALDEFPVWVPQANEPVFIAGAGHMVPEEQPAAFNRALLEFLNAVR